MEAREVRRRVLADHDALRAMLVGTEDLALHVLGGERLPVELLRDAGRRLLDHLERHMAWEDRHLAPALRAAGATHLALRLADEHREQREVLRYVLAGLEDAARHETQLARSLLDLTRMLREDMDAEEAALLGEQVLADVHSR